MNTEKTLKNSMISVIGQVLTVILQFVNRRIFIIFLDVEFLGYQTLFGNIFTFLSVAELGIGNIICFHLYKEIANDNKSEIGKLMHLYKWVYRIVAFFVLAAGIVSCVFIPYIVNDATASPEYLYTVYFLQLGSIVLGYFLSYRRIIFIANQKEYRCVQIDLYVTLAIQVIQLSTLAIFRNYILYLIIQLSTTIVANIVIYIMTNKEYPYLKEKYAIEKKDIEKRNLIPDVKNFFVHKVCYAVYLGTDNVIISIFCGIRNVALYGNYVLIQRGVMQIFFNKLLNPIQATIGNIVYKNRTREDLWKQFQILDVFSFFFAAYIGTGFFIFFQPAVRLWLGDAYLLSDAFVILYSVTIYFGAVWEIVYKYRSVFGEYSRDRNCMLISAVLNIVFSVILADRFGIVGVQIGTLIGFLPIAYGRIRFVVGYYFRESVTKYICKHIMLFFAVLLEGYVCWLITNKLPVNIYGMFIRALTWAFIPLIINTGVYFRSSYFKGMIMYILKILNIIRAKFKRN